MISDILLTAVTQIREELSRNDRALREWRARGVSVTQDAALRQTIYDVVDQMERLARRLLTEAVGPATEAQQ
jgi:DNA phosphorothioation-dependent restriction protein DptG